MKRLLMVTRNFPPLVGGMEKLNFHIAQALRESFDVSLAGPIGSSCYHSFNESTEFSVKPLWKYVVSSLFRTLFLASRVKPDTIFCGSGAAILAGFFASRLNSARLICYLHGLDIIVDNKIYKTIFLPLTKKADVIIVNSQHTKTLALSAGIKEEKIRILHPGVRLPSLERRDELISVFSKRYNIDRPFVLIAGRITKRKGIAEFIEHVMPILNESCPELTLVIVGDDAVDAMQQKRGLKSEIQDKISQLQLNNSVRLLGAVNDEMLSAAFFLAEMFVFPVLAIPNDVEGFGMVALEAAAHGLQTVAFSVGGVPDAVLEGESGFLVNPSDYKSMANIIINCVTEKVSTLKQESCMEFARRFEWEKFEKVLNNIVKAS